MVCYLIECDRSVFDPAVARLKRTYAAYAKSGELAKLGAIPPPPDQFELDCGYTRGEMEYRQDGIAADEEEELGKNRKKKRRRKAQWLVEAIVPKYLHSREYKQSASYTAEVCKRKRLRVGESLIEGAGDGLFTLDSIRSGASICQVEGQFMLREQIQHSKSNRIVALDRRVNDTSLYFNMATSSPAAKINDGTHVNDGEPYFNCVLVEGGKDVSFGDLNFLRVVATEDIDDGEELYLDYGTTYWVKRKYTKRQKRSVDDEDDDEDDSDDGSSDGSEDSGTDSDASDDAGAQTEEDIEGEGDGNDDSGTESKTGVEEGGEGKRANGGGGDEREQESRKDEGEREEDEGEAGKVVEEKRGGRYGADEDEDRNNDRDDSRKGDGEEAGQGGEAGQVVSEKADGERGTDGGEEGEMDRDESGKEGGEEAGKGGEIEKNVNKMWGKRSVGMDASGSVVCAVESLDSVGDVEEPESGGGDLTADDQKKRKKKQKKKAEKKAEKKAAKKAAKKEGKRLAKANKKKKKTKKKDKTEQEPNFDEDTQREMVSSGGERPEIESGSAAGRSGAPILIDDNREEGESVHEIAKKHRSGERSDRKVRRETDRRAPVKPTQPQSLVCGSGGRGPKGNFFQGTPVFDLESVEEPDSGTVVASAPSSAIELDTKTNSAQARALARLKGHNADGVTEVMKVSGSGLRRSGRGRGNAGGDEEVKEVSRATSRKTRKRTVSSSGSDSSSRKKVRRASNDGEDVHIPDCGLCNEDGELDIVKLVESLAHQDDDGWSQPAICDTCDEQMEKELEILKVRQNVDRSDTEFFQRQMMAHNSKGTSMKSAPPSKSTTVTSRPRRTTRSTPNF